jgi:hypothetical protein
MLHFRSSQKFMGLEILKNQGKLPLKQGYGPKQCHFMSYFGARALKGGKVQILKLSRGSL